MVRRKHIIPKHVLEDAKTLLARAGYGPTLDMRRLKGYQGPANIDAKSLADMLVANGLYMTLSSTSKWSSTSDSYCPIMEDAPTTPATDDLEDDDETPPDGSTPVASEPVSEAVEMSKDSTEEDDTLVDQERESEASWAGCYVSGPVILPHSSAGFPPFKDPEWTQALRENIIAVTDLPEVAFNSVFLSLRHTIASIPLRWLHGVEGHQYMIQKLCYFIGSYDGGLEMQKQYSSTTEVMKRLTATTAALEVSVKENTAYMRDLKKSHDKGTAGSTDSSMAQVLTKVNTLEKSFQNLLGNAPSPSTVSLNPVIPTTIVSKPTKIAPPPSHNAFRGGAFLF